MQPILIENEKVDIFYCNNGERFTTYIMKGGSGSCVICPNGTVALKVSVGYEVIIVSYALMNFELVENICQQLFFQKLKLISFADFEKTRNIYP